MPAFWNNLKSALKSAIVPLRPPNVLGPLISKEDQFATEDATTSARKAQEARVAAYEQAQAAGGRRGIWTNWVGFQQLASGSWIPVASSNVSAIRWIPIDRSVAPAWRNPAEDILAERRLPSAPHVDTGAGHGSPTVDIRGVQVDARDDSRIRSLLTPTEYRQFQDRMLTAQPSRMPETPVQATGLRAIAPTQRGKRITVQTNGILFVRFHDGRIYMYPSLKLSEALDMYQAASKGRWTWDNLRWSGREYQQIAGPPVRFRVGRGH